MRETAMDLSRVVVVCLFASLAAGADDKPENSKPELATHTEAKPLDVSFQKLSALCLHGNGTLWATDEQAKTIKVIDADGSVTKTIDLSFAPESLEIASDGAVYCGGQGQLALLRSSGEVVKIGKIPPEQPTPSASPRHNRPQRVSGLAVLGGDLFVAYGSSWSVRSLSNLYRFDRQFENSVRIVEGLRGCCQRCDIVARDGVIYVAENARHRISMFDRDGKHLGNWGNRERTGLEGFGACCNPMNLCFDKEGVLYTSESGLGRVKAYNTNGELLGLVGYTAVERFERASHLASTCSNIAIAVTPDAAKIYVMDYQENLIRVLVRKEPPS
jgi:DNA-binding beta-propeller fold protein YncE